MIDVKKVGKRFTQETLFDNITFSVRTGEFFGIIGPNGSGKSTLLKLITGTDKQFDGDIYLKGKAVRHYRKRDLAKWMAVLQQEGLPPLEFTVREVIEMGRYPFQNWLGTERSADAARKVDDIIAQLSLERLADAPLSRLSGGERQRVALGKVMAQEPSLLILDEPTTFLDIGYQMQLMDHVNAWRRQTGITVIAVLHDLNLAAQYCDRLLVLHDGAMVVCDVPDEVIKPELIAKVYGTTPLIASHPVNNRPQIFLKPEQSEAAMSNELN